ncbi:DUF1697 domain-containing protein [Nocardioides pocheonensis]|uniref:DUF1697 domain-containing protein n=1 Tax=Nocardioides pocheonensis TaxID=661485 RepID=A0A3N0GMR2_9ACTN|nr:DUF1697 domain-containing protein [Nocardioides pocheonensis]RNM13691.1 DUF1697 domain-containing protein [Nocardioides pocheonensis]
MPTHIGFLRAVNIGKRQYKTADLRAALVSAGYADVETHIQTGNIKVTTTVRSRARMEKELEELFLADRGFEVVTMVFSPTELSRLAAEADTIAADHSFRHGHYLSLLKKEPSAAAAKALEALSGNGETLLVRGRAVHLLYDVPYGEAKNSNAQVEKHLGPATNRNAKVIRALAEKWGS